MNKNIQIQDNNNWKKYIIENPYDLDSKNIEKFLLFSYKTWELDIRSFQNYLENPKYYDWIIKWENNLELTNRLNILWELVQELWIEKYVLVGGNMISLFINTNITKDTDIFLSQKDFSKVKQEIHSINTIQNIEILEDVFDVIPWIIRFSYEWEEFDLLLANSKLVNSILVDNVCMKNNFYHINIPKIEDIFALKLEAWWKKDIISCLQLLDEYEWTIDEEYLTNKLELIEWNEEIKKIFFDSYMLWKKESVKKNQ